ncbi:flagellar biosynthetic protein FlhB [Silvibacterium bohemicum]|uniref:Flagellar biosynthetic protein FlhB n=1 Tax=Silvibacterium bohemicum TaxID=1577686 RepID=A0A841JUE0_9BACT|nr:EscU/YscU/HrcU family type III secretion system export apparatus switch protein [Silvibacterium bohemicum]MBB6145012.1 flagellar biosynthetic protein FlhB [Silvibacterium bohemicum]
MADSSKTEQATPRRRQRARQQGQVTRSRELTGSLSLVAVAAVLSLVGRQVGPHWTDFFRNTLDSASTDTIEPNGPLLFWTSVEVFRWMVPILMTGLVVSLASGVAQGGFVFAAEAMAPKFERFSPANKLQQMFSPAALSNVLKSLLPFAAIVWVGVACMRSHWGEILGSAFIDGRAFANLVSAMLVEVCWKSSLILLLWSGVDYALLRLKSEGDLKMSRQEIREEVKDTDGNPANKARIRKMQRAARRKQMIKAAATATVVVTNPTHYAVALRYETDMAAPIVVAKGLDLLAAKIKEIARENDIPVMENKPLAQALYKGVEVGDTIPAALYHAVAEILVLVYKAQAEVKQREAQRRAYANPSAAKPPAPKPPTPNPQGEVRPL